MNGERGLPERERVILFFFIVNISYNLLQILYLIFDYPHKHYTFKYFAV